MSHDPVIQFVVWLCWLSNLVYFWLDNFGNATMPHGVAFKCLEKGSEHILPRRTQGKSSRSKKLMDSRHRLIENLPKKHHLCLCHFTSSGFDLSHDLRLKVMEGSQKKRGGIWEHKTVDIMINYTWSPSWSVSFFLLVRLISDTHSTHHLSPKLHLPSLG